MANKKSFKIKVTGLKNGRIRYQLGYLKGFVAIRKLKSRGLGVEKQKCFNQLHLGKVSIAVEKKRPARQLWDFAKDSAK